MDLIMKIAALGDSIIKGVLFTQEENGRGHYSLSDYNLLDHIANYLKCETINLGKMGCTISAVERILEHQLEHLRDVKYTLLCYGGNDSDYDWNAIANNPTEKHLPRTSIAEFEKTYVRIIDKVRGMGCTPVILSLPPMNAKVYFEYICKQFDPQQRKNVLKWLKGSTDTIWAGHELYNDAVRRVAEWTDTQIVDLTSTLLRQKNFLCEDGIHPNNNGYQMIAKSILNVI